jgi:hypothetical protein
MARVYLETSFFSACVSTRTDPASLARREESQTWWTLQRHRYDLFISAEVIAELSQPTYPNRENALRMTVGISLLPVDELALGLAKILVREHVMPGPAGSGDALHVAIATVHTMKHMLSWNVRHLANINKVEHLNKICLRIGYLPPTIVTPDALWPENEPGD